MNYDHLSMAIGTLSESNIHSYTNLPAHTDRQDPPTDSVVLDVTQDNQPFSLTNLGSNTEGSQNLLDNRNHNDWQLTNVARLSSLKWIVFNKNFRITNQWSSEDVAREILVSLAEMYLYLTIISCLSFVILKGYISFYSLFSFSTVSCFSKIIRIYRSTCEDAPIFSLEQRHKLFDIMNWTVLSAFIVVAGIRLSPMEVILSPYAIIGILNQIIGHFCSNDQSIIQKNVVTCTKLYFWIQIGLLGLKADGYIDDWWLVFGILFYTLASFLIVSPVFIIGIIYLYRRAGLDRYTWNSKSRIWYICNIFIICICALVLLSLIEILKGNNWTTGLLFIVAVGAIHAVTLTYMTLVYSEQVVTHMTYVVEQIFKDQDIITTGPPLFETIKAKFLYLLKISPTYYAVVDKDFKTKDKQVQINYKEQINEVKLLKRRSKDTAKLATFNTQFKDLKTDVKSATVTIKSRKTKNLNIELMCQKQDSSPMIKEQKPYLCYSDDDAEAVDEAQQKKDHEAEDQSCTICCLTKPNAVFMECGHGGVCYGCAMESWKNGDNCIFCRQPVSEILKVNVLDGVNVAKVVEGTKKNVTPPVWEIETL